MTGKNQDYDEPVVKSVEELPKARKAHLQIEDVSRQLDGIVDSVAREVKQKDRIDEANRDIAFRLEVRLKKQGRAYDQQAYQDPQTVQYLKDKTTLLAQMLEKIPPGGDIRQGARYNRVLDETVDALMTDSYKQNKTAKK